MGLRGAEGEGRQYFRADEVAIEGVIRPKWRDIVLEDAPGGGQRVNRINYEICVLQALRERHHWLAVATGKPQRPTEQILAHFGLDKFFDMVAGTRPEDATAGKAGLIDEHRVMCESALSIYRAGADILITYFAKELAQAMREGELG